MEIVKRSEVVLADLGRTIGSEQANIRPVIIVQEDILNTYSSTTVIIPCTSNVERRDMPYSVLILPAKNGFSKPSLALINQIKTIDKIRILKSLGFLSDNDMERIDNALKQILGLD